MGSDDSTDTLDLSNDDALTRFDVLIAQIVHAEKRISALESKTVLASDIQVRVFSECQKLGMPRFSIVCLCFDTAVRELHAFLRNITSDRSRNECKLRFGCA
jgi:hypothetical protein